MITPQSLTVKFLLSTALITCFHGEGFASAQSALRQRGIVTDSQTAAKIVHNPQLMKEINEHAKPAGLSPKEFVEQREKLPAATHPAAVVAVHKGGGGAGGIPRLTALAVHAPTAAQLAAANHLVGLGGADFTGFDVPKLAATVDLIAGRLGLTAIPAPTKAEVKAAAHLKTIPALAAAFNDAELAATMDLIAGRLGLTVIPAPTEAQVKAAAHLKTIPALAAAFNDAQLAATMDLIAGRAGLTVIPAPTEAQVKAAGHLKTIPALAAAFNDAQLKAAVYLQTIAAFVNFMQAQVEATVDLIAGRVGVLTAIPAPTEAQIKAAARLQAIAVLNFTTPQLEATIILQTKQGASPAVNPNTNMVNAVTSAAAAGPDVQKEIAWAIQNGFGGQPVDTIPTGLAKVKAHVGGGPVTHYDLEILWKDAAAGAWGATAARLFDGSAGFGHAGTTGFRFTAAAAAGLKRLAVGDLIVFSQLADDGGDANSLTMTNQGQHP